MTRDGDEVFSGFAVVDADDTAVDFTVGEAGASVAAAAVLVSGGATDAAGFGAGGAGGGIGAANAGGCAIETLARFFFPVAVDAGLEALEADADPAFA